VNIENLIVYYPQLLIYPAAVLVALVFVFKYPQKKFALVIVVLAFFGQSIALIWQTQTTMTVQVSLENNQWQSARAVLENLDNNWFSRFLLEFAKNIHVPLILLSMWWLLKPKREVRHA
jgi:hypothetical protein